MGSQELPEDWHQQKTYDSLMLYGLNAIKFVLFANGGAILSILTFLGNRADKAASLKCALIWFVSGVVAGGAVHVTAYLTQLMLFNEGASTPVAWHKNHATWLNLSIIFIVIGMFCFAIGASEAVSALS